MRTGDGRRPKWQRGDGDGLAQAFELVLTPLLFGLLGFFVDARLGTRPVMTAVLAAIGIAGVVSAQYYRYTARIAQQDEGKPWTRRRS